MSYRTLKRACLATAASSCIVASAAAQDDEQVLDEIVVTAQRQAESLQSVPIAVTAVTGDTLQERGLNDVKELALQTPGLNIKSDFGIANPNIYIRGVGIGDFNANVTGAVGVYIDEVYIASPAAQLFQFYDAEQVEILRGPQGTLFGRNTTAGAINFSSQGPTDELSIDIFSEFGNYDYRKIEGGVGGPVVPDLLNVRVSGVSVDRDGTLENRLGGQDLNDQDRWALRGQAELTPTDTLTLLGSVFGGKADNSALQSQNRGLLDPVTFAPCAVERLGRGECVDAVGYVDTDDDPFAGDYDGESRETVDLFGATLRGTLDLGDYQLSSVTGYVETERFTIFDGDQGPTNFLVPIHAADSDQFSQEVRLASPTDGRFRWLVGSFYFEEDLRFDGSFDLFRDFRPAILATATALGVGDQFPGGFNPTGGPALAAQLGSPIFNFPAQVTEYGYDQSVESWAAFGQAYFDLTDDLTLTGGLRYSEEDRQFDYLSSTGLELGVQVATIVETSEALGNNETSFDDLSYRAALEWQATNDVFAYASISEASKSGGFNGAILFSQSQANPFDDETLTAYEIGLKTETFGSRVRLNAAAFYYDYDDLQVYVLASSGGIPQQVLTNAAKAEVYGAEFELLAEPIDGLTLSGGLSLLQSEIKTFELEEGLGIPVGTDLTGNDLAYTPDVALTGAVGYEWPVSPGVTIALGADLSYQSEANADVRNLERTEVDPYTLIGARAAVRWDDDRWEAAIWGRNITDEEYISYVADIGDFGLDYVQYGDPATYGVSLRYRY